MKNIKLNKMYKKIIVFIAFILAFNVSFSQSDNLNAYRYVIVPKTYDFLKEADQYQLNSLSKFLFEKYGFIAIMDDEPLPEDAIKNICLVLYSDVIKNPGLMKSKLQVELKNCRKEIVFLSEVGESREKKYKVAYNLALRQAFESVGALNHEFKPNFNSSDGVLVEESETKPIKPEAITATNSVQKSEITVPIEKTESKSPEVLYAQPITNGYQLVDSTPKVIYTLIFSGKKDFYMVKGIDATVYKIDDKWVIAQTVGDDVQVKALNIKF